ncbi:riboflavin synthase [Thalassotalea sp. ND16A]|uniref:riboflavin synthase n=1 Tax=Thalassotalea sp. ND16A TaxID=1535422 RepID=UPI00051A107D|nr:riboflavin synthase [Thalassotalea sp. ND16A]KGJ99633.1 Riboflavin synthase [Thalassotalea sp. ND16A]
MFTGIVQSTAQVKSIKAGNNFKHFEMQLPIALIDNLEIGASVANNGVCLTAVNFAEVDEETAVIGFDVIDETLRVTNLDSLAEGSTVNIERSLKAGDEIGGHIVSGHIHTRARLVQRDENVDNCRLEFSLDSQWAKYIFAKGFITLNGCSLTLGAKVVTENELTHFEVHLIPETLARTNLSKLDVDDLVNIEIDQQTITTVDSIERIMAERVG